MHTASLVVTDLDGTLWNQDCVIPETTLDAMAELEKRGVTVIAATARNAFTSALELRKHGVALDAVLLNGALGRCKDGTTFFRRRFTPELARAMLNLYRDADIVPNMTVDHPVLLAVTGEGTSSCAAYRAYAKPFMTVVDLDEIVRDFVVIQTNVTGLPFEVLAPLKERFVALGVNAYLMPEHVFAPDYWTLLVAPPDAGKWSGVEAYCDQFEIDPTSIIAVGDGVNDVELLTRAPIGCAMAHAVPEVLAAASHVLPAERGWAGLLDLI